MPISLSPGIFVASDVSNLTLGILVGNGAKLEALPYRCQVRLGLLNEFTEFGGDLVSCAVGSRWYPSAIVPQCMQRIIRCSNVTRSCPARDGPRGTHEYSKGYPPLITIADVLEWPQNDTVVAHRWRPALCLSPQEITLHNMLTHSILSSCVRDQSWYFWMGAEVGTKGRWNMYFNWHCVGHACEGKYSSRASR
jgi:hypothetical protein